MKLVILITAQVENGLTVAEAWQKVGAPGVTIIRTHGLRTLQEELKKGSVELPRMVVSMGVALAHIIENVQERGELILSVVDDKIIDNLVDEASKVLGDLTAPNTGVMFVLDIERAIGVYDHSNGG